MLRTDYLVALGLEPLELRGADAAHRADAGTAHVSAEAPPRPAKTPSRRPAAGADGTADAREDGADAGLFGPRAARVCVLGAGEAQAQERLLRQIVQALGVSVAEVRFEAEPGMPVIALGVAAGDTAIAMPSLQQLRTADAKRAAWPALRRLRRRLRDHA
ncbi:hypothetical protein [Chiayiivirga flava]|uniref:Uncharacterized protein n=1 Tax=Chiayiivirga flava TaxID=659595 RepID=A0A7W8D694_9GAMM|nr:hypothetical protein [Chiayiivirga flava]MBB5208675.1 hypothetical protein [Chiayiivirga flava]